MLSPLAREDSCTSSWTTVAPRRLAASSKLTRVRVEGSVNRFATVAPSSSRLRGGRCPSGRTKLCARSSNRSIRSGARVSSVSRWRSDPSGRSCSVIDSCSFAPALKPASENDRRRGAVEVRALEATAPLAARALLLQRLARLERGEALIDQLHGKGEAVF